MLAKLFSNPNSDLAELHKSLWACFLGRYASFPSRRSWYFIIYVSRPPLRSTDFLIGICIIFIIIREKVFIGNFLYLVVSNYQVTELQSAQLSGRMMPFDAEMDFNFINTLEPVIIIPCQLETLLRR